MKKYRFSMWFIVIAALLLLSLSALAEPARVLTPGGKLNMRRSPDDKAKLVDSVPNRALVDATEIGPTWTKITYKKQSGYVKTEFLILSSALAGKTVYPDEGSLLIRKEPRADAPLAGISGALEAVRVDSVTDGWAQVTAPGGITGYAEVTALSYQWEEPQGTLEWISLPGIAMEESAIRLSADASAPAVGSLTPGQEMTVTAVTGKTCLIMTDSACGYVPAASVCLSAPADNDERAGSLTQAEAVTKAEAALAKKFKAFAKEKLYCLTTVWEERNGLKGPFYECMFLNDQDQCRYVAEIHAETGEAAFLGDYTAFAVPVRETAQLLPSGEVEVSLTAESLPVGGVLDVTVEAWTRHQCAYDLYLNGKQIVKGEAGDHFQASYRPRQPGEYRLIVTVTDEKGTSVSVDSVFAVSDEETADELSPLYSQKDGWWADKKYRHSNLGKSGCAIFTLSHALQRLGFDGDDVRPENLAVKYAYCLIKEEGTNNTLLINTAAKNYGFKTQGNLINDEKKIVSLLQNGTLFSFSPAKGHIAMVGGVSEDGTMAFIVDSAPGATFERISGASLYYQLRSGGFRAALSLRDIPGARWYLDTGEYGGLEYWLPMSYVAKRGVRLIQPLSGE